MTLHSSPWEQLTGNLFVQVHLGTLTAYFGESASIRILMILQGIMLLGSVPRNLMDR